MTDDKEKVWERLKYVPMPKKDNTFDFDVNSMYASQVMRVFPDARVERKEGDNVTIKVLKNR